MRFYKPNEKDIKQETKFLLIPLVINGETRWLETTTVEYVYTYVLDCSENEARSYLDWVPTRFIND